MSTCLIQLRASLSAIDFQENWSRVWVESAFFMISVARISKALVVTFGSVWTSGMRYSSLGVGHVYVSMSSKLQLSYRVSAQHRAGIHATQETQRPGLIPIILFVKRHVRGAQFELDS